MSKLIPFLSECTELEEVIGLFSDLVSYTDDDLLKLSELKLPDRTHKFNYFNPNHYISGEFESIPLITGVNLLDYSNKFKSEIRFKNITGNFNKPQEGKKYNLDRTFYNQSRLISCPKYFDGENTYNLWEIPDVESVISSHYECFKGCTNLPEYDQIPEDWK